MRGRAGQALPCPCRNHGNGTKSHSCKTFQETTRFAFLQATIWSLFELRFCRTYITALRPCLRDGFTFREKANSQADSQHHSKSLTEQRKVRQTGLTVVAASNNQQPVPIDSPTLSFPLIQTGRPREVNASRRPVNCPSGGRNDLYVPLSILRPNRPVVSLDGASTSSQGSRVGYNRSC